MIMFHEDIWYISNSKYIKTYFWLVVCIAKNLIWTTLKVIFSVFRFFLHLQIPDFQIVVSRTNIVLSNKPYINGKFIYSDNVYISIKKNCGPGSHLFLYLYLYSFI